MLMCMLSMLCSLKLYCNYNVSCSLILQYGFSSFVQRDVSYNIIFKVWQNSLLHKPLPPLDLVKVARKAWGDSTEVGTAEELWGVSDAAYERPTGMVSVLVFTFVVASI